MRTLGIAMLVAVTAVAAEPAAKGKGSAAKAGNDDALVLYEYDDGTGLQQVESLSEVPKKFRSKATKVTLQRNYGAQPAPIEDRNDGQERSPGSAGNSQNKGWSAGAPTGSASGGGTRASPQPPPAKSQVVYCQYYYLTNVARMQRSFCTSGSVSAATTQCEQSKPRGQSASECYCTADTSYISTRCD